MHLSIKDIQRWLQIHQNRLQFGDSILPLSEIANRAGISRQTLYAVLNNNRTEFGQIAQIRLSRVIGQISSETTYKHSKIARIDLTGAAPRIKFGV
jgi:predicted DNA-binding transcriptional regulator AlpA